MTARSFTEAFGLDASHFPDDALSTSYAITDLQHGCSTARYQEAIDTLAKSVPAIIAQRDSARDWAVALEGQNARLEAKIAAAAASAERIGAWVEFHTANHGGKPRELTDISYWTKPLYLSDLAAVAALTGGEDE